MTASSALAASLQTALDDAKGVDILLLDVRPLTSITDYMLICTGTSSRHVKTLADKAVQAGKALVGPPLGIEGDQIGEWVLIDFDAVLVHVMISQTREFYALEKLWDTNLADFSDGAA